MEDEEDGTYEIEVRNGLELRYHKGKPGDYVGVAKRVWASAGRRPTRPA